MSAAIVVFVVCVAACVVGHAAILWSTIRTAASASGNASRGVPGTAPNLLVEVVWAVIPAIVLAFVLTATWARIRERPPAPPVIMRLAQ